ncbi:2-octaprenylphenol hydroxylase [Desulforamulus putei DSM 12395]|uniref:2-octaprenylphenol hydroxylase n=2 Tax=Desulforamulus putei TaxID=74701 RepID=A0A1M5CWS5_9FIRM|nr:2-octaprenylphenol hydroxylase [Desulforamulus putei DSM 12395]
MPKLEIGELKSVGQRIRQVIEELGPTFIKMGQIASTRPDVVPSGIIDELEKLQDNVPSFPFSEVRQIIQEELGIQIEKIFVDFEEVPLAAASIGQVHRAVLISGETVAVKVQRPHISTIIETDLEILMDIAGLAEQRLDWAERYQITQIIDEFAKSLRAELDYTIEGRNAEKMARQFSDNSKIRIPKIYEDYSAKKVLTMEYIQGTKLSQTERLIELGYDTSEIAKQIVEAIFHQILIEGFFHGDPHPGNILVLPDQVITFLDFGMVGRLTPQMKHHFASLVIGMIRKNTDEMIRVILDMGIVPSDINISRLRSDVDALKDKYLDIPLSQVRLGQAVNELFTVAFNHRIRIPPDLTLLGKSLLTLEGSVEKLDPKLSVMDIARPFGYKLLKERYRISSITKTAFEKINEYVEVFLDVPKLLKEMTHNLKDGNIRVEVRIPELGLILKKLDRISNQLSFSIVLLSFSILMMGIIIASALGERLFIWHFSAVDLGFMLASLMFVWLLFSILRSGRF